MANASSLKNPARPVNAAARPLAMLPAQLVMLYLASTLFWFVYWPMNWPIYRESEWVELFVYVTGCYTILYFLFRVGTGGAVKVGRFDSAPQIIVIGAIVAAVLLTPSSYLYSGRWPWQVLEALQDQGEAYRGLQDTLIETSGQRGPISALRAFTAPLVFAVLPLGILNWQRLGWRGRTAVIVAPLCSILFSILRGTDREFADIFIVGGSALLISLGRQSAQTGQVMRILRRYWRPAVIGMVFVLVAANLFSDRKEARLGGTSSVCAVGTGICVDLTDPRISWMGERGAFAASMFTMSVAQGYYGLTLAMQQEFESTLGIGHSPTLMALYESTTGDTRHASRAYTVKIAREGWLPEYFWSTGIIWFANDLGFLGVLPLLAVIGFYWGRSWRDATAGHNDAAAVLFCLFMVMMVYLPANNQVFNTFDGYFVLAFWSVCWMRSRRIGASMPVRR